MPARVFFGQGGGSAIYAAGESALDGGAEFGVRAKTDRLAPAGVSGEAIFPAVWVALTWTMAVTVVVTVYVDGALVCTAQLALPAQAERVTKRYEIGLSVPMIDEYLNTEVARFSPRGTWLQVALDTSGPLADGELIFEGVECEFEVVVEDNVAVVAT